MLSKIMSEISESQNTNVSQFQKSAASHSPVADSDSNAPTAPLNSQGSSEYSFCTMCQKRQQQNNMLQSLLLIREKDSDDKFEKKAMDRLVTSSITILKRRRMLPLL